MSCFWCRPFKSVPSGISPFCSVCLGRTHNVFWFCSLPPPPAEMDTSLNVSKVDTQIWSLSYHATASASKLYASQLKKKK